MWTREQLKSNGMQMFKRNYWICVAVSFVGGLLGGGTRMISPQFSFQFTGGNRNYDPYSYRDDSRSIVFFGIVLLIALVIYLLSMVFSIFVGNVVQVGVAKFYIRNRSSQGDFMDLFYGFKCGSYKNVVFSMFMMYLFIALWTLLFIIPGIIKGYEYMMVPYIIAENPGMNYKEAMAISKRMMDGQKWDAFVLGLSFLGWIVLCLVVCCGIPFIFFLAPYMNATYAELYSFNKIRAYQEGFIRQ